MEFGACRGLDSDLFFPDPMDTEAVEDAKAVCALCPVILQCLTFACATDQVIGVWGGQSELERRCDDVESRLCALCGGDVIPVGNRQGRCVECNRVFRW